MKKLFSVITLAAVLLSCLVPAAAFAADEAETEEATLVDDDWYAAVPYESWDQFEPVETDQSWYDVYKMPGDVYAIWISATSSWAAIRPCCWTPVWAWAT